MNLHFDVIAEGEEGKLHQFEVLHTEWDADNCDAEDDAPEKVGQSNRYSSYKPPDDIHDSSEAP